MIDFGTIINFTDFGQLLPLVTSSLIAGAVLGVLAGFIGPMIHARDLSFAVHGTSELSFAGASVALFLGVSVTAGAVAGSLVAAVVLGLLGVRAKDRNASIGIMLPFGMGIGVLFLSLYKGRSANKFGLLTGQIVAVDTTQLTTLCAVAAGVAIALAVIWRPLFFASADPEVAKARGVPMRTLSIVFMVLLGLTTAMAIQLVGALLVLSLLVTPTAAAAKVTARPSALCGLSVLFAVVASVGGILLSLGPGLPVSPYVTTISFVIYLICLPLGALRRHRGWSRRA